MKIYKSLFFLIITSIILYSCNNQGSDKNKEETKKRKLSPNEIYSQKVDATCTILTDEGQGSGFFIDSNLVVTNYHVIANANFAEVILNNESKKFGVLGFLSVDKINDLVLLMVDYNNKCIFNIEREIPNPGDHVLSISTPIGLTKTLSDGLISGKKNFEGRTLIQITVPISHGSSGCPIINEYGDVVGIAVGGIEEGNNLNFCIPTSYLTTLLDFKESYPTMINSDAKNTENSEKNISQTPQNKNAQGNEARVQQSNPKATIKNVFHKPSEIVSNEYKKNQILDRFYNDKCCNFMHNSNSYNIDYNSLQIFEYDHQFKDRDGQCIKYVLCFTDVKNDGTIFYKQMYFDIYFNEADAWSSFEEREKNINFWASFHKDVYNTPCN